MADLLKELEAQIAGLTTTTARQNVGVIREVGDGVARVEGLTDAMLNEMLDLGHGITGLALNLEETEVGVVILGDYTQLQEGDEVRTTGKLLQVPVGKSLLGRVVNTLGEPLDGKGPIESNVFYPVEKLAPGIIRRSPVRQPVQTGIMAIDAMIPIGRGQRELIIGDRSTGKTTICIDTIISQACLNKAAETAGDKDHRPNRREEQIPIRHWVAEGKHLRRDQCEQDPIDKNSYNRPTASEQQRSGENGQQEQSANKLEANSHGPIRWETINNILSKSC